MASYTAFAPVFRLSPERAASFDLGDPPRPARVVTESEARERWESQFPDGTGTDEWRDAAAFDAFWDAVHDSNQGLLGTVDPAIRAPNRFLDSLEGAERARVTYCGVGRLRRPRDGDRCMRELSEIETVGVVGAGTMGNGIAQVAATSGYDVVLDATETLHDELGDRYKPAYLVRRKVDAGDLGKKSGKGFYEYD